MGQLKKLWERIKNNPKTVRFDELSKILKHKGYNERQPNGGSSHYTYRKYGEYPITIPKASPYIKEEYVKQVIDAVGENL
ncbi:MAG: hypothetical protein IKN43_09225 [Selenomonadaceae bacterium]|nr:hypothetical protein [Selenomonadaceae bacterium]